MHIRKALTVLGLGAVVVFGAMGAPAQASVPVGTEVTCGNAAWPHQSKDGVNGEVIASASVAVHTGPYGDCATTGYLPSGTKLTYDCYAVNDYNNTWTWVRDPRGASIGWVYDAYLSRGGSSKLCDN
jgi:hypothetical protein